ncbi:MAG: beta-phosphoglucomutase [Chloroflexi bacterium]|nr:beta-phosphoglucomutase [Chloroflexota bacterium]
MIPWATRAVIFDLDGVLTDTAELHFQAWKRLADEEGLAFTREDNERLRGVSRHQSLEFLLQGRTVSEVEAEALMSRKNKYYQQMIRRLTPADLLPGVAPLLTELRQANLKIAIASASRNADEVIERLGIADQVDALGDGNSVERQRPAPDLLLHVARQLGVSPEQCVVVDDAAAGIEAALAAGMRVVGLGPASRVGNADIVLANLDGIHPEDILAMKSEK